MILFFQEPVSIIIYSSPLFVRELILFTYLQRHLAVTFQKKILPLVYDLVDGGFEGHIHERSYFCGSFT